MKVCKFGGSSLASAEQFKKIKKIIDADSTRRAVVVSAPGKRNKDDYKITDLLYLTFSHLKYKVDYSPIFNQIKDRYYDIKKELNLSVDLDKEFALLEAKMKNGIKEEELVSRGEYFNALLMADYLGYRFIDAKDIIFFTYEGKVDEEKTNRAISDICKPYQGVVVPGFYGAYPNGEICLFSRGGSDVTGSYVAKGLLADKYENFTDVSGFYMTDPRIVDNPRHIDEVTYDELRELSYMGASVLHEATIIPIADSNIPLEILNTNAPEEGGTIIQKNALDKTYVLTGITGKKNFIAVNIVKDKQSDKLKVLMEVLNIFNKYHVSIEQIPTSIDSFSVVVEKKNIEGKVYDILGELKLLNNVISVSLDEDIALVAVVGRNMISKAGISGKLLSVFGKEHINIKIIAQGMEELSIIVGISNQDFDKSIKALYDKFAYLKVESE